MIRIGQAEISVEGRQAYLEGVPVPISGRAFDILRILMDNPNQLVTKQALLDAVWPGLYVEENNVHVQISYLRRLLKADKSQLETIPRRGYRLNLAVGPQVDVPSSEALGWDSAQSGQPIIYIVDDDPGVRNALLRQCRVHGLAALGLDSAEAFLERCDFNTPGCLLLDINLKQASGLDLQAELARRQAPFPIVFITGFGTIEMAVRAMKNGAQTLLVKPFDSAQLLGSLREALGQAMLRFEARRHTEEASRRFGRLSVREIEVFDALLSGAQSKAIARQLNLSEVTIKVHKKNIFSKLELGSMADLFHLGQRLGRVMIPPVAAPAAV